MCDQNTIYDLHFKGQGSQKKKTEMRAQHELVQINEIMDFIVVD